MSLFDAIEFGYPLTCPSCQSPRVLGIADSLDWNSFEGVLNMTMVCAECKQFYYGKFILGKLYALEETEEE